MGCHHSHPERKGAEIWPTNGTVRIVRYFAENM